MRRTTCLVAAAASLAASATLAAPGAAQLRADTRAAGSAEADGAGGASITGYEWVAARYELTLLHEDREVPGEGADPWHYGSLEAGMRRPMISPIGRLNFASRHGAESLQLEADLYPVLRDVGYAYLSAAWSAALPFPELRLAGEGFVTLPAAYEASAGVVYMDFDPGDVTILVGSLAKYAGNYWIALRPSWVTDTDELSLSLIARRYLRDPMEFVTLRAFYGASPEEIETTAAPGVQTFGMSADAQLSMSDGRWALLPLAGVVHDDLSSVDRLRVSLGIGAMYRF